MPEPEFAAATLPLFADGLVDVVEWSFDMTWGASTPDWLDAVLAEFADAGRLDGHGVSFSLLSRHPRQEWWLSQLKDEVARRPYRRISEHVGFMSAGEFARSSPLPMPHDPQVVALGREQLARLGEWTGMAIGLENLATSLARVDATNQGALLEDLCGDSDGWLILDLHNLWCQAQNFDLDPNALLTTYPVERVHEIHVSGGSWWAVPGSDRMLRRDTHDGLVPRSVLDLLPTALELCERADTVILERVGPSFDLPNAAEEFCSDFLAVRERCGAVV